MSGIVQAGFTSAMYHLQVSGGISSWDYDSLGNNSRKVSKALTRMKPMLNETFRDHVSQRGLPIVKYNANALPEYIDGVLIESETRKESMAREHFLSHFKRKKSNVALAFIRQGIPGTAFQVTLSVLVTERVRKDDMELLALKLAECIQESEGLRGLSY